MSSLHPVLRRELYAGRVVWNKSAKRNSRGERRVSKRPEGDWIIYDAPELRIVPPDLWARVQTRLGQVRRSYTPWTRGKLWGGPPAAVESKHLLLGFVTCQQCGGSIAVRANKHGTGRTRRRVPFYGCVTHWNRGRGICSNALVVPTALAEDGVLAALDDPVLFPSHRDPRPRGGARDVRAALVSRAAAGGGARTRPRRGANRAPRGRGSTRR